MTSVSEVPSDHAAVTSDPKGVPSPARIALKPDVPDRGKFDGAWWPRSSDATAELSAFVRELTRRGLTIRRISLDSGTWCPTERRVSVEGSNPRIGWFYSGDSRLVRVTDSHDRLHDVLVIPWDGDEKHAVIALRAITNGQDPGLCDSC